MSNRDHERSFSRGESEWDRERGRRGENDRERWQEESRQSFHPGGYGFEDPSYTERGSGSGGEYSQQYGQREPYASGSGGGTYGASGYERQGRGGQQFSGSRYSESQYGQGYDRDSDERSRFGRGSRNWDEGQRGRYSAGYNEDWRRYADRGPSRPAFRGQGYGFEEPTTYGADAFRSGEEQPQLFGVGYYGDGGSGFGGGYGEERSRNSPSSFGQYRGGETGNRSYAGSGRGGYGRSREEYRGEQQRPGLLSRLFKRGPKGYQRSDERLREDISERLMQSGNVDSSEVTVMVVSGAVTLEGSVPDRYMKHYIEDLVDACPGVQDIDNRIRVDRNWAQGSSGIAGSGTTGSGASSAGGTTGLGGTSMRGGSSSGSPGADASGTTTTGSNGNTNRRKDS